MDSIVQLVRNALCCVKDWQLFPSTFLYDPSVTAKFYAFPSPHLNETTPLELLISLTQLYACISCTIAGIKMISSKGIDKLMKLKRVSLILKDNHRDMSKSVGKIIVGSVMKEATAALKDTFVGVCVLLIGISFFWLFANSLHITAAGWIGGLPALIHALTVMEVALVPLLYLMIKDGAASIKKSAYILSAIAKYSGKKSPEGDAWLDIETFMVLAESKWTPFWESGSDSVVDAMAEEKVVIKEIEKVERTVKTIVESKAAMSPDTAERLQEESKMAKMEGYREYVYFILNFIAFYGYLLGIIVYYFDKENEQPSYVGSLKLGYSNEFADWAGNFAGDLMWTIEPAIILSSPFILQRLAKGDQSAKVKAD